MIRWTYYLSNKKYFPVKNIIVSFIISHLFLFISPVFADEVNTSENRKFIVTAYYSPLPDQNFYIKGSYEADILLNGNGTHGASGKEVYPGMLAWPKTYNFGIQIYLEGLGIGTIDDRGGAIVSSGSRGYHADRLDIWMGKGEEGLKRALSWGKRTLTGKIIHTEKDVTIDFSQIKIEKIDATKYTKQIELWNSKTDKLGVFNSSIGKNSNSIIIKELQTVFTQLSYYNGSIDGKYSNPLINAIYDFQIENQLVKSVHNYGAGYYGIKTREKLQEIYTLYTKNEKKRAEEDIRLAFEKVQKQKRLALIQVEKNKKEMIQMKEVALFIKSFGDPKMNEIGVHVRNLQQGLKSLGYFNQKDTAIFGKITQNALISYQTSKNIPSEEFGQLGKITKEALLRDLLALKERQNNGLAYNAK